MEAIDLKWFNEFSKVRIKYNTLLTPDGQSVNFKGLNTRNIPNFNFNYTKLKKMDFVKIKKILSEVEYLIESEKEINNVAFILWSNKINETYNYLNLLANIQLLLFSPGHKSVDDVQNEMLSTVASPKFDILTLTLSELSDRLHSKGKLHLLNEMGVQNKISQNLKYEDVFSKFTFIKQDKGHDVNDSFFRLQDVKFEFEKVLKENNLDQIWQVKYDLTGKYKHVLVFYQKRIIMIPNQQQNENYYISHKKLLKLIAHEIYTHVIRSNNGFNSNLKLLSIGLDSSKIAEEGLATFREQSVAGSGKYFSGFENYISICLALGLDRGMKRSPAELFVILKDLYQVLYNKNEGEAVYVSIKRIMQIYITLGDEFIINTRGLFYREGNIKIHKFLSGNHVSDKYLNIGIYDPTNYLHVKSITDLGLLSN